MTDNEIKCPHCNTVSNIGGLVGEHTNDCPKCGKNIFKQPTFKQLIESYDTDTVQAITDHARA